MYEMNGEKEQIILVGLGKEYGEKHEFSCVDPFEELSLLARTAGAEVVGRVTQTRPQIEPRYYIGHGKVYEVRDMVNELDAAAVIFDNDLTPAQVFNLQKLLNVKVIDRSGLILDIFAIRARTSEAKVQVELAQLKHLLPQLTRQWTHLSRQVGGIGVRGPGETQLEVDRRRLRSRIVRLEEKLKKIEKQRITSRGRRKDFMNVTLVGYTNAGKSTLFNALSKASAPVEDKLFKTLDSMARMITYDGMPPLFLSDTVGFIRNLPHELIASFKSTLSDVLEADLLIHVIDSTNPEWEKQRSVVEKVLGDIGSSDKEIITAFNKIDLIEQSIHLEALRHRYPAAIFVSAREQTGLEELKRAIRDAVLARRVTLTRKFGAQEASLLSRVYRYGTILETSSNEDAIILTFTLPIEVARRLGFS